jgi:hypothetical protein
MTARILAAFLACLAILTLPLLAAAKEPATTQPAGLRVTGPVTHENLAIYLIHGQSRANAVHGYITLQEGIEQKKVFVHETNSMTLAIENKSDQDLFVQAGEVVKGGDQDRTLDQDTIIPPESGLISINCHCVEHGRSSARGTESERFFNASTNVLASKELKLANYANDQEAVWAQVDAMQSKLSSNVAGFNLPQESPTSFQLTLEAPQVQGAVDAYTKALSAAPTADSDVVGYVFAINGKLNAGDVYASHDLLMKLWPKLLTAAAVEAISNRPAAKAGATTQPTAPSVETVAMSLADADTGVETHTLVVDQAAPELTAQQTAQLRDQYPAEALKPMATADRASFVRRESDHHIVYETRDAKAADAPFVHRTYLVK